MKVSVIVPVYNVENYVEQCLQSLADQTHPDLEVIVVNDGCTDSSATRIQHFVERYPERFQMITKKNGGLSDARNAGLPYATGDVICFLDSDDYVEPTLYEKFARMMEAGYDVVVTDLEYFYEDGSPSHRMKGLSDWNAATIQKKALLSPMFAWNKAYKAEWFKEKGYRYPVGTWYEDIPVTCPIFALSDKIGYLDEMLIHYRQRSGSIMSVTQGQRLKEIFQVLASVRKQFDDLGLSEKYHQELEYLHTEHLCLYGAFRFLRSNLYQELTQMSIDVMQQQYPNYKKNVYLKNLGWKNRLFIQLYGTKTSGLFHHLLTRKK